MTLVLVGKGLVLRGWPSKIDVFGAPDTSTHRLPFRWEDFVCLFFVEKQKVLNLNWVCRVHIPFFYITLTGVSNDIFHPHVFFLMLKRDIYMKYYIFLYIYLYMYLYWKPCLNGDLQKGTILQYFRKKNSKNLSRPPPQKNPILSIAPGAVAETLFQGGQSRISGGPPVAKSLVWGKWSGIGVIQLLMADIWHQLRWSISQYLHGFIHPKWCGISEPSTVGAPQNMKGSSDPFPSVKFSGCKEF